MQYTIRNIPKRLDRAVRQKAKAEGKSLNEAVIEVIESGLNLGPRPIEHHDLDFIAGTWVEDPDFDRAIKEMDRVDPEMWE